MRIGKFFRFTISGDNYDPEETRRCVDMEAIVYKKGEVTETRYGAVVQKTNRWVYSVERTDEEAIGDFLTRYLKTVVNRLDELKSFILDNNAKIELILYAGDKTDLFLSKEQIKLLNALDVEFCVSFC